MKTKKLMIVAVLLLAIGFAAVSTTLVLTGVIGIGANDDFSVIFTKALLNGEASENAVISADKKTITFTTDKMTMVDETQVLDYTVKNNSTQYDANVTINCTNLQSEYVTVVNTLDGTDITTDNETYMEAQESKDGDITITMIKPYIEDEDANLPITCNIVAEAVPRDDEVDPVEEPSEDPTAPTEVTIITPSGKPSSSPIILTLNDGEDEEVVPTGDGKVVIPAGKRVTGIFTAGDSTCNLLLGICDGITASLRKQTGWVYDHSTQTVSKGDIVLNIGDYVNYDAITGVDSSDLTYTLGNMTKHYYDRVYIAKSNTKFRVLGAENGQLLIISDLIKHEDGGGAAFMEYEPYTRYETELNTISSIYGHGEFADSVRSVRISDINTITGYNPYAEGINNPTAEQVKTGYKANYNGKYNDTYTYTILEDKKYSVKIGESTPTIKTLNVNNYTNPNITVSQILNYYDFDNDTFVPYSSVGDTFSQKISDYFYNPKTLSNSTLGTVVGLTETSLAYKMLFVSDDYLLADRCVSNSGYGSFIVNSWQNVVCNTQINLVQYEDSFSGSSVVGKNRAVIRVKKNATVSLDSTTSDEDDNTINTWNLS